MLKDTTCVQASAAPIDGFAAVAAPITRASTVVFPNAAAFERRYEHFYDGYTYGLYGTPTSKMLEQQLTVLNGGSHTVLAPSGQAAITLALLTLLRSGDHVLVPDTVYGPTRTLCDRVLTGLGVKTSYYDPLIGTGIAGHIQRNTKLVVVESPGSVTMEVQDVPAIAAAAHRASIPVLADNTWAGPLLCHAFERGCDLVLEALSKHASGHGDVLMGSITVRDEALFRRLKDMTRVMGLGVSADDAALVLRGLQTLPIRIERSAVSGLKLAEWLAARREVDRVLHPALAQCPGHDHWRRDYVGTNGVFSVLLAPDMRGRENDLIDALKLFKIGASWGGTQSLVAPQDPTQGRTATRWTHGKLIRFSVGLEAADDLLADLESAFGTLSTAAMPRQSRARAAE